MRYFLTLSLLILFTPATARADVPAPSSGCGGGNDYVETCTVDDKQQEGTSCDTCQDPVLSRCHRPVRSVALQRSDPLSCPSLMTPPTFL